MPGTEPEPDPADPLRSALAAEIETLTARIREVDERLGRRPEGREDVTARG